MAKSTNRIGVPEAREAPDQFKTEASSEAGVNLKQGKGRKMTVKYVVCAAV